jgi:hypothetical protein
VCPAVSPGGGYARNRMAGRTPDHPLLSLMTHQSQWIVVLERPARGVRPWAWPSARDKRVTLSANDRPRESECQPIVANTTHPDPWTSGGQFDHPGHPAPFQTERRGARPGQSTSCLSTTTPSRVRQRHSVWWPTFAAKRSSTTGLMGLTPARSRSLILCGSCLPFVIDMCGRRRQLSVLLAEILLTEECLLNRHPPRPDHDA